jgi:hypothetical protein
MMFRVQQKERDMVFSIRHIAFLALIALAAAPAESRQARRPALPHGKVAAIPQPTPRPAIEKDWTADVKEAQALLAPLKTAYKSMRDYHWLLAVKCGEGKTAVVKATKDGSGTPGYRITRNVDNGINTRFVVSEPFGCVVLAQKRVVRSPSGLVEAVYTAYNPALDTPAMRKRGLEYLEGLTEHAYDTLERLAVPSLAYAGQPDGARKAVPVLTVAEAIPRDVALGLQITEHIDPARVRYVGLTRCIHEVLVTFAANGEHAYDYAVSAAGARGISQFMRKSYDMVRSKYPPDIGLIADFAKAMDDHRNATIASILHFDVELFELPPRDLKFFRAGSLEGTKNGRNLGSFLAAGYNWNAKSVARIYAKTGRLSKGLPKETRSYVSIALQVFKYVGVDA